MICSHCGAELPEISVFCPECGTLCTLPPAQSQQSQQPSAPEQAPVDIPATPETCPVCGIALTPGSIFCTNCGANTCDPSQGVPMQCTVCGAALTKGMQLCPQCASPIYPTENPPAPPAPEPEPIILPEPIVPIPAPVKTCANCGAELAENQKFCSKCGTAASEPAATAPGKHCVHCGAELAENQKFCTKCGTATAPVVPAPVEVKPVTVTPPVYDPPVPPTPPAPPKAKKKKKGPGPGARVLLRLLSFLLCLCLTASLLLTVVVLDLRQMTSRDNLQRVISSSLTLRLPNTAAVGSAVGSKSDESILRWVYDSLKEELGPEMDATYDQMEEFFEKSSAKEFLAEKSASYLSDLLTGTNDTEISRREIAQLINENADLIEDVFGEVVTPAMREDVLNMVESAKLDELIKQELIQQVRQISLTGGEDGYTVEQLLADLNYYTSDNVLWALVAINLLLVVLLLFTNWFRLSNTIKCAAIPMIVLGILLSIPTVLLQILPTLLTDSIGGLVGGIISAVVSLFAPVHYVTLAAGIVLLIVSFIIKGFSKLAEE